MLTIESLKENKAEIIDMITLYNGANDVKRIMAIMVKSIGCRVYEGLSVMAFTKAVIEDNKPELIISDSTDYYAAASKRQLGSTMR